MQSRWSKQHDSLSCLVYKNIHPALTPIHQDTKQNKVRRHYPCAACWHLQLALCMGQCTFWHVCPQYRTDLHTLHSLSLPFPIISFVAPHHAHSVTLGGTSASCDAGACIACCTSPANVSCNRGANYFVTRSGLNDRAGLDLDNSAFRNASFTHQKDLWDIDTTSSSVRLRQHNLGIR